MTTMNNSRLQHSLALGLMLAAILVAVPKSADAAPMPSSCLSGGDYGDISGIRTAATTHNHGTSSSVYVQSSSAVVCQRISSIFAWHGSGGFEFGYVVGYSNCSGYTGTFYSTPTAFRWAVDSNGAFVSCKVMTTIHPATGTYPTFKVEDTNANKVWAPWLGSDELSTATLNFSNADAGGWGLERAEPGDSFSSEYDNLKYYSDSTGWTSFNTVHANRSCDPGAHYASHAVDEGYAAAGAGTLC